METSKVLTSAVGFTLMCVLMLTHPWILLIRMETLASASGPGSPCWSRCAEGAGQEYSSHLACKESHPFIARGKALNIFM